MKKSTAAAGLALCAATLVSAAAFAQAKPETLVAQRQAAMTLQGKYLYSIIPMAQGKVLTTPRSSPGTSSTWVC